jgi:hypothetical protein
MWKSSFSDLFGMICQHPSKSLYYKWNVDCNNKLDIQQTHNLALAQMF